MSVLLPPRVDVISSLLFYCLNSVLGLFRTLLAAAEAFSVFFTSVTNFTNFFILLSDLYVCLVFCLFLSLSLSLLFLCVRVSLFPVRLTVSISGAADKGGQGGAGPLPGASDSRGGACSGAGAGPSRSDSVRSMVTGGSKAGRWQTVQSHMHAGGLRFSK